MTSIRPGLGVLVVAEAAGAIVHRACWDVLTAARAIGGSVSVVLPGHETAAAAEELASRAVTEVIRLEHEALAVYTADAFVEALAAFITGTTPSVVVFPHTYRTRDYAPALATRLGRSLVTDCIGVRWDDALVLTRPMFQGKVHADVVLEEPAPHFITCQIGAFHRSRARQ